MHFCSYIHDDAILPRELREQLESTLFGFLVNPESGAPVDPVIESTEDGDAEAALGFLVGRIIARAKFSGLTDGNAALSERVAHDALHWCANQWALAESSAETPDENALVEQAALAADERDLHTEEILDFTSRYPEMAAITEVYRELLATRFAPSDTVAIEKRAARELLVEQWRGIVRTRELRRELSFLHGALLPYVAELNRQVPMMHRYMETVKDLFGSGERFWDLSEGRWQEVDVGTISQFANLLSEEPTIQRLAEILGRGRGRDERAPEVEEEVAVHLVPYAGTAGRSQVTGIRFGNDVGSLLASELALLSSPVTESLFYKKFAESELLCLAYTTENTYFRAEFRTNRVQKTRRDDRGPLLLCVDTSGSMAGVAERVAKAMAFAIVRIAVREARPAFVIAFSDRIETIEVTDPAHSLGNFVEFLRRSFYGGTDLRPAIDRTLEVLEREEFRNADVLLISDFRIPKILDRHTRRIKEKQRTQGTGFYSLTVNRSSIVDPFNIFDRSWLYDISHPESHGIPVRSLTPL
ncbi:MAG TPA: VWA domain-containing protein [Spirochaetia bacterium]|nr:VWA domain-containing protein [Spirochaetia bacterium]